MGYLILGTRIDPTSYPSATQQVLAWAQKKESRYVCVANVKTIIDAFDSPEYRRIVNRADLVTPDGVPLVWTMRQRGARGQTRVYGLTLTLEVAKAASQESIPVGLLGGTPEVLDHLALKLTERFPDIKINYRYSPPFRTLSPEEDGKVVQNINASGARILFIGLGSPKQDRWMADHSGRIQAVMLGVGAAFDFIAGAKRQAPRWMQNSGLEWLYRLSQEPRRLWWRYFHHNPRFIVLVILETLFKRG
jgi:N-acetylglucosaminyldiphosphoundecaprenol N-acetyl-beta-D-mannosaminyltransferase